MINFLLFITVFIIVLKQSSEQKTLVTTQYGILQGIQDKTTGNNVFLGIPYASPPITSLRFKPPQPIQSWAPNIRPALDFGPSCISVQGENGFSMGQMPNQSEDCLYLNIWAPANATEPLSVMVWIHGGSFKGGSSSEPYYKGNNLSKQGNVIVVTINYRLGLFGFLASELFSKEDQEWPTAGNFGLLDQNMALQWVRDNIKAFGGDSNQVTIFGESAGSFSICSHILMPKSKGLFKRAILESNSCAFPMIADSEKRANKYLMPIDKYTNFKISAQFLSDVGCKDTTCLRNLSDLIIKNYQDNKKDFAPWPYVDGLVIPDDPVTLFKNGNYNKVDIIYGNTMNEGSIFAPNITFSYLPTEIKRAFPLHFQKVLSSYSESDFKIGNDLWSQIFTDFVCICPGRNLLKYISSNGGNAYHYYYTNTPSFLNDKDKSFGAFHGAEIFNVFNETYGNFLNPNNLTFNSNDMAFSNQIMDFWSSFAKFGVPTSNKTDIKWAKFTNDTQYYIDLNSNKINIGSYLRQSQCDVYDLTTTTNGSKNIQSFFLFLVLVIFFGVL